MTSIPKVSTTSAPIANEELEKLRSIFPQFVKDGDIDFDALKAWFEKERLTSSYEKFGLRWAGKQIAYDAIRIPSVGTLTPHPEESIDWDKTQNVFIEGDNLEVLKLLQKHYREQVKMIYIDPPYNTGKDFVYKDNFTEDRSDYYERTGQTKDGIKMVTNAESNGRYHSDWLTMMYPRLFLAKNLLRDDGVIFVSIDDVELHHLKMIMNEVFGEENFIAQFVHKNNSSKNQAKLVSVSTEYFLCYSRNLALLRGSKEWRIEKKGAQDIVKLFEKLKREKVSIADIEVEIKQMYQRPKYAHLSRWNKVDEIGVFVDADLSREGGAKDYTIRNPHTGVDCVIPERGWGKSLLELQRLQSEDLIWYGDPDTPPRMKEYISEENLSVPDNFWYFDNSVDTRWIKENFDSLVFENPKPLEMIRQIVQMAVEKDESGIILDFFAGSGTTAHAVMDLNAQDGGNRRYICVQLPEATDKDSEAHKAGYQTIADIARERIRRAGAKISKGDVGFKSYHLAPSAYRQWHQMLSDETTPEKYLEQQKLFTERPLIDGYDPKMVVYEIALKEGYDLHATVSQEKIGNISYWTVRGGDRRIIISFADTLSYKDIESLEMNRERDLFVCLDSALTDTVKINIMRNWQVKTI